MWRLAVPAPDLLLLRALGGLLALLGALAAERGARPGALLLVGLRDLRPPVVVHPVHAPQVRQQHVQLAHLRQRPQLVASLLFVRGAARRGAKRGTVRAGRSATWALRMCVLMGAVQFGMCGHT
jgi:hypothetical protein